MTRQTDNADRTEAAVYIEFAILVAFTFLYRIVAGRVVEVTRKQK